MKSFRIMAVVLAVTLAAAACQNTDNETEISGQSVAINDLKKEITELKDQLVNTPPANDQEIKALQEQVDELQKFLDSQTEERGESPPTPDTVMPTVRSVTPADGATNVGYNVASSGQSGGVVKVEFSEPIDCMSVGSAFQIKDNDGNPVALLEPQCEGTVLSPDKVVTLTVWFRWSAPLQPNTQYHVSIAKTAKGMAGNPLSQDFSSSFTTATTQDPLTPTVLSTTPQAGEGSFGLVVSGASTIKATFSRNMDATTINSYNFVVEEAANGTVVSGSVALLNATTAIFSQAGSLKGQTVYKATIKHGVKDIGGHAMAGDYSWTFKTAACPKDVYGKVVSSCQDRPCTDASFYMTQSPDLRPSDRKMEEIVAWCKTLNSCPNTEMVNDLMDNLNCQAQ